MTNRVFSLAILVAASAALFFACPASDAADWPMWRHDAGRSAATDENLPAELHLQWSRQFPSLTPAWPEDPRLLFDANYEPVVLGDTMFVASSRNDSVTAIDTNTGAEKWRFYAEGPVRLAPVATNGKVYFGADDGNFYCLRAASGTLQWKFRAAPAGRRAIGNERLISVWPNRGGAVLVDDTIYFTVGVWPFEGTMLYAIDLGSSDGRSVPEYTVTPLDNFAPQGHLAASNGKLFIPGGRSNIYCRDLQTEKQVSLKYDAKGTTDYHVMAADKWMFHGGKVVDVETRAMLPFVVNRPVVDDGKMYFSSKGKAHAYDLANQQEIEKKDRQGKTVKIKVPTPLLQFSAQPVSKVHLKTAKRLFAHHGNTVFAIDVPSGDDKATVSFTATIEGTPASMLAANGKLFVVTAEGSVYCYGAGSQSPKKHALDEPVVAAVDDGWPTRVKAILDTTEARSGYCLALGIGTGQLIEELSKQTQFHLIAVDRDAEKVDAFRRRLDANGLYGTRVVAHVGNPLDFELPPYLASLVVAEDPAASGLSENPLFPRRVFHVLRPYGGAVCLELSEAAHNSLVKTVANLNLPNTELQRAGDLSLLCRKGALPGSADWTHEYSDPANTLLSRDKLVKAPLGVLWFGGPSSDGGLFFDRHQWGPSMAVIEGRMFIQGPEKFTAVDVYTGRILWQIPVPKGNSPGRRANWGPTGFHFVALKDAIYLTYPDRCLLLDPKTGKQLDEFRLQEKDDQWGRIRIVQDRMIVPVFKSVEGSGSLPKKLIAMDRHKGTVIWTQESFDSFPLVAIGDDTVFCVDGLFEGFYKGADKKRRNGNPQSTKNATVKALDVQTGAEKWTHSMSRIPSWLAYSEEHDVLVASNKSGIDAWSGGGEELWTKEAVGQGFRGHPENYYGRVILRKDQVIDQRGPGAAYNIRTGESIKQTNPITGEQIDWKFTKIGHHCNYAIASEHLLTFRAADAGFCDLDSGETARLVGFRSGCRNSLIPANGVLNAPNFAHGCVCGYSLFTSLALVNVPQNDLWTYSEQNAGKGRVERLGINFGAPGDRRADDGTVWMEYPNVSSPSPSVPIKVATENPKWFRLHTGQIKGQGLNWVAASGVRGVRNVTIPLVVGNAPAESGEHAYTVELLFVQPAEDASVPDRFDVAIQGRTVLHDFTIEKSRGDSRFSITERFKDIQADRELTITFTPKQGETVICGVRVIAQADTVK